MKILPFGSKALLINFEQKIDPAINAKVIALQQAIEKSTITGWSHCIPAYCSLTVVYDPVIQSFEQLRDQITALSDTLPKKPMAAKRRQLNIPVCYEAAYAPDLEEVGLQTGLSTTEIIELHTSTPFQVYMLGFLPGFAYMGKLPPALRCSRKTNPRLRVAARSVGLAGLQTGIYPSEGPGGWQIIGQTPLDVFSNQATQPFLFQAGDQVYFHAISDQAFQHIRSMVIAGTFDNQLIYE